MNVSSTAFAALSQAAKRVDQAAEGIARATRPADAVDDRVELSTEAVSLLVANNGYDAAIGLAKTADEISRRAIDLLA
ncbi:MAG: hypothetical protein WD733_01935 [Bryobacterales bacterium]